MFVGTSSETANSTDINIEEIEFETSDEYNPNEITQTEEPRLPSVNPISNLHSIDNSIYAGMDEEAFAVLV